ncbi:4-hydroxythreonine-4-phosphate dehydrogenase PdxA [Desulfuromonas sp. AOP6]|uniref:4-hydroxythreonine-4-phosphate dehydrogenase PdxA n=1 Tax=Desulfuromonas sp. AOP6 TaxID=1566351 RepID=UPI001284F644|nr:4-hydroxythreonine-4-phosphate dehydrogenase PdxA [Desulfuromonas sp. AOP6]BCA81186.1 4-hydroxythreonine-4-phosphate dehydrogenase [Desulfuromonas sp. AOP6]
MEKPVIVSMGDPVGVGPELLIKALISGELQAAAPSLLVAGDAGVLARAARIFDRTAVLTPGRGLATHQLEIEGNILPVRALSELPATSLSFGQPTPACGRAMLDYIEWSCDQVLAGHGRAMVTGPINKEAIHAAGCDFPGHTELLAHRCRVPRVVMMLGGERLKVCLVTTHMALNQVPTALTTADILETIRLTDAAFRRYFVKERAPRLAVLALNPHAGEGGLFGDEEQRLIVPAIAAARREGIEASGPHSADTLFHFAVRGAYDAVVCMYHDQGLIPLKLLHFEDGVNVTLGLPIIRTSVDHGTAYDLAGTGRASCQSLLAALRLAEDMAAKDRDEHKGSNP